MANISELQIKQLQILLRKHRNPDHAIFHKNYHKSPKKFYGLKTAVLDDCVKSVWHTKPKLSKADLLPVINSLWNSDWFEEQAAALMLLERVQKELTPADLPMIKKMVAQCEGWAMLDYISTKMLGAMAMQYGDDIYPKVRKWSSSKHLWTRRASILIHVLPARRKQLRAEYAFDTFEELLHEKEFFIRKAIGWTLREIVKHYPESTFEFLREHLDSVSGLTLREGGRALPISLRKQLGLKK